ncbi:ketopantoate reductase family protein [Saccharicrinis aurantiacus]|uniref:ketopantoate reductase family protein n=1 Tax=Saccharicrinis aurantiacus TaxID=1849719 RepID=UPI00083956FA|nr:ketopantoate reductase family protein [Saccharicrinis aurantiacus]
MRIAIIGAGGVGGYFGGRLAQGGNSVTIVARGAHGEQIKKSGLHIKSPKGDAIITNILVVKTIAELMGCELIILGVKAWQVKDVAKELCNIVNSNTIVIPLQNGVLAAKELCEFLPTENVMGGLCSIFSKIESPGVISHMSAEPTIVFGELDNSISERSLQIKKTFDTSHITNKHSNYIQGDTWKKFVLICLGGLGALTRSNYGELLQTPELRSMLFEMLNEMYAVAISEGIELKKSIIDNTMSIMDNFSPDANSSMARDIWNGKPSELEYQNGTVVMLAEKNKIEVPVNYFIYQALLPSEKRARNTVLN